jgi:hypothetical protein
MAVIGPNLMSRRRRNDVIETARSTVAAQLRRPDVRGLVAELPAGRPEAVARPPGPPSSWPNFVEAARERFEARNGAAARRPRARRASGVGSA